MDLPNDVVTTQMRALATGKCLIGRYSGLISDSRAVAGGWPRPEVLPENNNLMRVVVPAITRRDHYCYCGIQYCKIATIIGRMMIW